MGIIYYERLRLPGVVEAVALDDVDGDAEGGG
jgi:hypothetical protein